MKQTSTALLIACASLGLSQQALAFSQGDIVLRAGFATVSPNDSSSNIFVGTDQGVNVTVDDNTQIGLTLAYFISDRTNIEVLGATPFTHDVNFGANDPLGTGNRVGEVTHLPPTVTMNYYFTEYTSPLQAYVGVGLNFTAFFDEEFSSENDQIGLKDLSLDNSFGIAAQIGADYFFDDHWLVNAAVRWIDIDTQASFTLNGAQGSIGSIEIDPFVYSVSIGYLF